MSRRHKTIDELKEMQSRQRGSQGDNSQKATSNDKRTASCFRVLNKVLVTKRDDRNTSFSLKKIIDAITKSMCSIDFQDTPSMRKLQTSIEKEQAKQRYIAEKIQQAIAAEIEAQEEKEEVDSIAKRGRRKIKQLLGKFKNSEVLSWFEKIRGKFRDAIVNLKELMVCFFCAVFDMTPMESRHGKATCFYEMIEAHLKEKIPSKSMFQKALKWFKGWRKEVTPWKDRKAEEEEHGIWEKLYFLIMKELPLLEPRLAAC